MDKASFEQKLAQLPLFQYSFMKSEELTFSDRVRTICETECPRFGTTWACPPAVGPVETCKARCLSYPELLMISTVTEVRDIADMDECLSTSKEHEAIAYEVAQLLKEQGCEVLVLSTESCSQCARCTYPDAPCRKPERMFPCVESHGILVTELCEKYGMEFFNGNIVTWFSLLLFR